MRFYIKKIVNILTCATLAFSFNVNADSAAHQFGLGIFHYSFRQPSEGLKINGPMVKLNWRGDQHFDGTPFYFRGEGEIATSLGKSLRFKDTEDSLRFSIPSQTFEIRALLAYRVHSNVEILAGLGDRFFHHDMSVWTDPDTGERATKVRSNYVYLPVGIEYHEGFGDCEFKFSAEYDWIVRGRDYSRDEGKTIKTKQDSGYGSRLGFEVAKRLQRWDVSAGPFLQYWHIKKSDDLITIQGPSIVHTSIPRTHILSAGFQVKFRL